MKSNLTDTQKFKLGNEIACRVTRQHPAVGTDHQETKKMKAVRSPKRMNVRVYVLVVVFVVLACVALRLAGL